MNRQGAKVAKFSEDEVNVELEGETAEIDGVSECLRTEGEEDRCPMNVPSAVAFGIGLKGRENKAQGKGVERPQPWDSEWRKPAP